MPKLLVICPNCKTKYPVANQDIAGKQVTCKKCSQKFTAKIYSAKPAKATQPPASSDPLGLGSSDPLSSNLGADDFFADMPAPSSTGPALAPLPAKRKKASAKPFPVMPIAMAGGGVALLAIIVYAGITIANSASNWSSPISSGLPSTGNSSNSSQADFDRHHQVLDTQMNLMNRFIDAMEQVNNEQDLPQFVSTVNGLTNELRDLATKVSNLPRVSPENNKKLSQEAEQRTKEFLPRMKAAGARMAQYNRNQDVTNAMLGFQAAGKEVSNAISSAQERFANSPAPNRPASSPPRRRSNKPLTDFQSRYGFENTVTFQSPAMNVEHGQKISEQLKPMLVDTASAGRSGSDTNGTVIELHYQGDINDLVPHITFGDIERVDVNERTIYMKSVNLP
ncbi:MJ0042-type zinc finger domain-containing protein [Blastopirellula marina]|uniref:Zinc finger/thioredoxin putative domain-containing protein n=1 Tax=Blastopirellula marina TaxID=124 RepID=A0A2S8GEC0_9BACT|nr:MJ0042-type zinc finger domain-containing protein [Blastopirellula marina]PQO42802.1 hypothetical protein C5Y98_01205 [Blastopirellula marina]PTL46568.1 hypothetical protein C5Y97_01205 [Blastopirellula marina]